MAYDDDHDPGADDARDDELARVQAQRVRVAQAILDDSGVSAIVEPNARTRKRMRKDDWRRGYYIETWLWVDEEED